MLKKYYVVCSFGIYDSNPNGKTPIKYYITREEEADSSIYVIEPLVNYWGTKVYYIVKMYFMEAEILVWLWFSCELFPQLHLPFCKPVSFHIVMGLVISYRAKLYSYPIQVILLETFLIK